MVGLTQFLHFGHAGFFMYRPLSPPAYSWLLQALFGYDSSGHHAAQLLTFGLNVRIWVKHLGQYLIPCFNVLSFAEAGEAVHFGIGLGILVLLLVPLWQTRHGGEAWRLLGRQSPAPLLRSQAEWGPSRAGMGAALGLAAASGQAPP